MHEAGPGREGAGLTLGAPHVPTLCVCILWDPQVLERLEKRGLQGGLKPTVRAPQLKGQWCCGALGGSIQAEPGLDGALTCTLAALLRVAGDALFALPWTLPSAAHAGGVAFWKQGETITTADQPPGSNLGLDATGGHTGGRPWSLRACSPLTHHTGC